MNLYDSCVDTKLTRSLMLQLKQIYEVAVNKRHLRVNEMPVQQHSMVLTADYSALPLHIISLWVMNHQQ